MSEDLFLKLQEYTESDAYPFHMPGHKRNPESGLPASFYKYDITEIDDFDNLHQPRGIILDAQNRAEQLYHSEETYFLVNGSTAGILSAVSAIAQEGKKLIVARNCHKAVYHGAVLNRLEPEYIYPVMRKDFHLADGISTEQIEKKLKELARKEKLSFSQIGQAVGGIVITSPTYDGLISDVKGIVDLAHSLGIPVIVDQAHGAHFGFHDGYPQSAVREGADLVIHSVHKTLPAPTQTALLHKNGNLVNSDILRKYLRIYQSSSPSYLLMAGIDSCIQLVEKEGSKRLEQLLVMRSTLLQRIQALNYIQAYPSMLERNVTKKAPWKAGTAEPGRLVLMIKGGYLTGQEFYDLLRTDYHLQMEMCGADYVVAILSMMDREEGFIRLADALMEIDTKIAKLAQTQKEHADVLQEAPILTMPVMETAVPLWQAFSETGTEILIRQAEGEVAADFVNLYPPGIPLLVPGERIHKEIIAFIEYYLQKGYDLQGIRKVSQDEAVIKVLRSQ